MDEQLSKIHHKHKEEFSGACLITQGTEVLLSQANGLANRDFHVENNLHTRFDTASVTKAFTAVGILQLVQRDLLRLDDNIHDILDLTGTAIPSDVQLAHLLNHTSGIADDADEEAGEDYAALFVDKPNYAIRHCADFLPQFAYKPPNFKAGKNVRYNNCAYVLLGLAIEQVTDMDYRSYVTEHVFNAAGMQHSYFGAKDEVCPNTAEGYVALRDEKDNFIKWRKNIYSYPPIGTADGGALTTVGDLDRFIRALKDGALLSQAYTDMIFSPHCPFPQKYRFGIKKQTGYGFNFLYSHKKLLCVYKEGCNTGVSAICSYYPALNIGLYMLANQDGSFWAMHDEMQTILLNRVKESK